MAEDEGIDIDTELDVALAVRLLTRVVDLSRPRRIRRGWLRLCRYVHPRKAFALIIERDLTPYVVYSGDPVLRALEKITANKARVIFLVDSHGHLDGVLSDGDFRRWVSGAASLTVDVPAIEAANTSPRSLPIGSSPAEISHAFGSGIDHVALVDERGHLVAIAINRADELRIGRHVVGRRRRRRC